MPSQLCIQKSILCGIEQKTRALDSIKVGISYTGLECCAQSKGSNISREYKIIALNHSRSELVIPLPNREAC